MATASGGNVTFTGTADINQQLGSFTKFNPQTGTLNSVTISYSYIFSSNITVSNSAQSNSSGSAAAESYIQFGSSDQNIENILKYYFLNGNTVGSASLDNSVGSAGNNFAYNLQPGASTSSTSNSNISGSFTDTNAQDLSAFSASQQSTNFILNAKTATGIDLSNTGGNTSAYANTSIMPSFRITYNYTPQTSPTIVSDNVAPSVGSYGAGQSISFTLGASEPLTVTGTPTLTLNDGGAAIYTSGSGSAALVFTTTVAAGQNAAVLAVTGVDLSGGATIKNAAGADAVLTGANKAFSGLQVDTTAPAAPSTPAVSAASDSGSSSTDGITNITAPVITGTAEAGSMVTLYDTDGTTALGTATATGGNWSITSSALSSGTHVLTAKATDAAGNVSAASAGQTVTIDTTAPAAPSAPTLSAASDSGVAGDGITNVAAPVVTGTAEANAGVVLYDTDGTTIIGSATASGTGNWSITSATLADGNHTLSSKAVDTAGNVSSASTGRAVAIDTAAPLVSITTPSGSTSTSQTISGTVVDGHPGSIVALYDNGASTPLGTATVSNGAWSTTVSLAQGSNSIIAKSVDLAGNTGTSTAVTYMYVVPSASNVSSSPSAGPDLLSGTGPSDVIAGQAGDDTITGGGGNSLLLGNQGNDIITAGDGQNTVYGGMDNDRITVGNGSNLLYGNEGTDTIAAGNGGNTIVGGQDSTDGADLITSGSGNDLILGNGGDDTVAAGGGADTIVGGYGRDIILGNQGNDIILGNQGDDTLYGGQGADTLVGGMGNDVLYGNEGDDVLYGNEGLNTFVFAPGDTDFKSGVSTGDTVTDFVTGTSRIDFASGPAGSATNFGAGSTTAQDFASAQAVAQGLINSGDSYAFVSNGTDGYLFTTGGSGTAITDAVKLAGAGAAGAVKFTDIAHGALA